MIKFASSTSSFGYYLDESHEKAFTQAKTLSGLEFGIAYCLEGTPESEMTTKVLKNTFSSNKLASSSIHLPYGGMHDISSLDEDERKNAVNDMIRMIRAARDIAEHVPEMTLHSSSEPGLETNRKLRISNVIRSIEEMLPEVEKSNSRLNVEFLPRTCIGHDEDELLEIVAPFDPKRVGINFDVNHVMSRKSEIPSIIKKLASRINAFHFSDYDGVDEQHWPIPYAGVIDWHEVMKEVNNLKQDITIIFEWTWLLKGRRIPSADPAIQLQQLEYAQFYLTHPGDFAKTDAMFAKRASI